MPHVCPAGSVATCPVVLKNAGNMRVDNVAVLGDTNDCSKALMAPDETLFCTISRQVVQAEYEAGTFTLHATGINGTAKGPVTLPSLPADVTDSITPTLTQLPQLATTMVANVTNVNTAGDTVLYTITAVRHGSGGKSQGAGGAWGPVARLLACADVFAATLPAEHSGSNSTLLAPHSSSSLAWRYFNRWPG